MGKEKVANDHSTLREKLQPKGYMIVDEFACKGGMNKGRPNAEDLKHAEKFALNLKQNECGS